MIYYAVLLSVLVLLVLGLYFCEIKRREKQETELKVARQQIVSSIRYKAIAAMNLYELFDVHKEMAQNSLCKASGPCQYGIVRVSDIRTMTPDNIYLGNVHGLWTHTLPQWNECNDQEAKGIVMEQYRRLLLSDLEVCVDLLFKCVLFLEYSILVCEYRYDLEVRSSYSTSVYFSWYLIVLHLSVKIGGVFY